MYEMIIESIRVSLVNYQRVVILRVKETGKYLPIWIGSHEADSIAYKLQDISAPRPLTHDLLNDVITKLDANVNKIIISGIDENTFFAKIELIKQNSIIEIDCRPSDAIALAVRTESPIFAVNEVIEKAGVKMEVNTDDVKIDTDLSNPKNSFSPISEEEVKNLSAYSEFIETLNTEDLT
ncbi:MAG: bifunctional nuclease family protein [SAR202 cluster bacterium]|nr:bifunctional nuclease family protein [SAR202 cluster bacterium]|tara:strand:- start:8664 stop:9203 length:540 start_codon:yes stop_codon:yes gene_type:complete